MCHVHVSFFRETAARDFSLSAVTGDVLPKWGEMPPFVMTGHKLDNEATAEMLEQAARLLRTLALGAFRRVGARP